MRPEEAPHTAPSRGIACVLAAPPPAHTGEDRVIRGEEDSPTEVSAVLDIDTVEPSRIVRARCGWRACRQNLTAALGARERQNSSLVAEPACSAVLGHHMFNVAAV